MRLLQSFTSIQCFYIHQTFIVDRSAMLQNQQLKHTLRSESLQDDSTTAELFIKKICLYMLKCPGRQAE